jgi:hypothetical protein
MSQLLGRLVIATLLLTGCSTGQAPQRTGLASQVTQVDEYGQLRASREKQLSEMSVADLAGALQQDSTRGREPWNSLAVAEVQRRGSDVAAPLAEFLKPADQSSFLTLMSIRMVNQEVYGRLPMDVRIAILVDRLSKGEFFNAFGLPHLYWEDPARAIIEEGKNAEPALFALLKDDRPAPMWGEEQVVEYEAYQYRVADYALALIRAIRGDEQPLPQDPAARDDLIRQLSP